MRVRTNIIIEEKILARIDALAGERIKRAATIEKALLEYIEREEAKAPVIVEEEIVDKKAVGKRR